MFAVDWFMPNVSFGYPVGSQFSWQIFLNFIPTLLLASLVFTLLHSIVRPILKILAFPFNLLTFGFLYFLIDVFLLWLLIFFVPSLQITPLNVFGFHFNYLMSFLITAFIFNFIQNLVFAIF